MFHLRKYWKRLGPGLVTGASDDDPSGVVTYSQAGAWSGTRLLWTALFTTPMMIAVQEMSARLGLVTKQGLISLIRRHRSSGLAGTLAGLLLMVNVVNIGADVGAMAAVTKLLWGGPTVLWLLLFGLMIVLLEINISYQRYANVLKWLTLSLLTYVATALVVKLDWGVALRDVVIPNWPRSMEDWTLLAALFGTTISPYLFFWQASEEVEAHPRKSKHMLAEIRAMRRDTATGMIYSNLVMFFIIAATAATLHAHGITLITTAEQAASALRPVAGPAAFLLFAIGIIGTGLLAIPVLAGSAGYAVAELFRWREGLNRSFQKARAFYGVIAVAVGLGMLTTVLGLSPITMLVTAAVLNGLLAPIVLAVVMRLADDPAVVGEYRSPSWVRWLSGLTVTVMGGVGLMVVIDLFR